jgi:hypothetical protein
MATAAAEGAAGWGVRDMMASRASENSSSDEITVELPLMSGQGLSSPSKVQKSLKTCRQSHRFIPNRVVGARVIIEGNRDNGSWR